MTHFHRGWFVPGHAPAQNKDEADKSRATKTGQVYKLATGRTKARRRHDPMKSPQAIAIVVSALLLSPAAANAAPSRAAILPLELDDTSLQGSMQGPSAADHARLGG